MTTKRVSLKYAKRNREVRVKAQPVEPAPLEKNVEKAVCDYAWNTYGVTAYKLNTPGRASLPDRMFLIPGGRPLFIEFKRRGLEPTKIQQHTINGLRAKEYDVEACDNKQHGKQLIDHYYKASEAIRVLGRSTSHSQTPQETLEAVKHWKTMPEPASRRRPKGVGA